MEGDNAWFGVCDELNYALHVEIIRVVIVEGQGW